MYPNEEEIIQKLCDRFDSMKNHRSTFENHWEEVADVVSPTDRQFTSYWTPGEKKRDNQFDSTAELAINRASSFYDSVTTPRNQRWHKLASNMAELNNSHEVRAWYDKAEDVLFQHRYGAGSGFPGQRYEQIQSLWKFGNGVLFCEGVGGRIRYRSIHLSKFYMDENPWGVVDVGYRIVPMTRKQIIQQFGEDKLPRALQNDSKTDKMKRYEILHTCEPNPEYNPESILPEHRRFISYYVFKEQEKKILGMTGYGNFPYAISRDVKSADEIYGRSVTMAVLPTTKMLNEMKKTHIRAAHKTIDPPVLMRDDGALNVVDLRPGRALAGGLDSAGNPTIQPFNSGTRLDISIDNIQMEQNLIREAFLLDLFINNLEREATATEVMTRSQEQARLLSPLTGREETESLSVLIERELALALSMGLLPEMPEELVEAQGDFKVEYTSPIANSQKSDQALGARQTVQAAMEAANFDPNVLDNINWDEYLKIVAEATSAPTIVLNSPETVQQMREAREQQQMAMQMAEAAPKVAQAELNTAQAQQIMGEM